MNSTTATALSINASIVPNHLRPGTLPKRFPHLYLVFEMSVFNCMDKFVKSYNGGYWEYIDLSNGGFYMSLKSDKPLVVEIHSNDFAETMSADAASLVANLFVYCRLANQHQLDYLIEGFHALREFALIHPESKLILSAIN